jgi:outer membrane lipoprotein carrier protein
MKLFLTLLAGLFISVWTGQAFAVPQVNVGLNDIIATVERSFKPDSSGLAPVNDVTADFFQRTTLAKDRRELRGDGQMSVKMASNNNPLMYRFEYFRPYAQEIVSDGKVLWIYHPENREVILSDVSFLYNSQSNPSSYNPERDRAVNFLQGLGSISRDFQINFASGMNDAAGNYVLELTPRRAMINTRRIFLVVNRDTILPFVKGKPTQNNQFGAKAPLGSMQSDPFPILSTTIEDQEGNTTTIEFSNIRINTRLPLSTFIFTVPAGVQIIKPSERNLPY